MQKTKSVPTAYVKAILEQVTEEGFDVHELLAQEGLSLEQILASDVFPADKFGHIYQRIMTISQDEYFGMLNQGKLPNGAFRMMCHAIIHASSLGSAIQRATDFHEICRGAYIKPALYQDNEFAYLHFQGISSISQEETAAIFDSKPKANVCTTLSMWHHFISWLIGQRVELQRATFAFSEAEALPQCQSIFQSRIEFNQPRSQIIFPSHYLDYPVIQTETSLHSFLKTAPYQLVAMVETQETFSAQIAALIGRDCSIPPPSAEQAASALGVSVATLRRRLAEEDTNYQKIKDNTRMQAAIRYLQSPQLSINEVAALMGFDELSAFYRSFKRWTGQTPSQFRAQNSHPLSHD